MANVNSFPQGSLVVGPSGTRYIVTKYHLYAIHGRFAMYKEEVVANGWELVRAAKARELRRWYRFRVPKHV